jgi:hypothetical protein
MDIYRILKRSYLAAIYCNHEIPNLFRIHIDFTLISLKHQLSQLNSRLHCGDATRVIEVEYRRLLVCSDGIVLFIDMILQNNVDARTMFSIFFRYNMKGPTS